MGLHPEYCQYLPAVGGRRPRNSATIGDALLEGGEVSDVFDWVHSEEVIGLPLDLSFQLTGEENLPPNAPTITGPQNGKVGIDYNYTFVSIDPDGDDIWYHICWGDKEIIYIYGPYPSGEPITLSYNWTDEGTYTIQCKARDVYDAESDWATLEVTMPYNYHSNWWMRWLDRFPLIQRLLGWFIW